ncbi:MAG: hypothetical protein ABGZ24_12525, partial [Fuerstiella sp.]
QSKPVNRSVIGFWFVIVAYLCIVGVLMKLAFQRYRTIKPKVIAAASPTPSPSIPTTKAAS